MSDDDWIRRAIHGIASPATDQRSAWRHVLRSRKRRSQRRTLGLTALVLVALLGGAAAARFATTGDADTEVVATSTPSAEPAPIVEPDDQPPACRQSDIALFGMDPSTLTETRLVIFNTRGRSCAVSKQTVAVENSLGERLEMSQVGGSLSDVLVLPTGGLALIIRSSEVCSANLPDGLYGTVVYGFNDNAVQGTSEGAAVVGCSPSFEVSENTAIEFDDQLRLTGSIVAESAYQPPTRPDSADAEVGGIVGVTPQGCVTLSGQGATFPAGSLWSDSLGALILANGDYRPVGREATGGGAGESRILRTPGLVPDDVLDYFSNCGFGPESNIVSMSTT